MSFAPYSISKMGTYFQCPHKFKLNYIDKIKVPFETNVALIKGKHIHEILEHDFNYEHPFDLQEVYTQEDYDKTIEIVKNFENGPLGSTAKLLIKNGTNEEDFAFDYDGNLVGYWDKSAFFRGSADGYMINEDLGVIWDWKSGKDKSQEEEFGQDQSKMYGIYLFLKYHQVQKVKATFIFVEHNTKKTIEYTRDNLQEYMDYFKKKTSIIEGDKNYKKCVTALCDWCQFSKHLDPITGEKYCKGLEEDSETDNFMKTKIIF